MILIGVAHHREVFITHKCCSSFVCHQTSCAISSHANCWQRRRLIENVHLAGGVLVLVSSNCFLMVRESVSLIGDEIKKKKSSAAHAEGQLYAEKKNVHHIRPANRYLGASGAIFFTQFTLFTTTNLLCYFKYMQRHIALGYRCQISYKFASNSCNILSLKCIFIIMGYSSIYSIWILNENQFLVGWPGGLVS